MKTKQKLKDIQEQKDFCDQLMKRVAASISGAKAEEEYSRIQYDGYGEYTYGHTILSNDIKRLRRELLTLNKMVAKIYD